MNIERCEVCGDAERCGVDGCGFEPVKQQPKVMLCPACNKPMVDGQAFNGLYGCHWDCTDVMREKERAERPPRKPTEVELAFEELRKASQDVAEHAEKLDAENQQLRAQLAERDALLKRCEAAVGAYDGALYEELRAISASAEPSAPTLRQKLDERRGELVCKGSKALGTACGNCSKCKAGDA